MESQTSISVKGHLLIEDSVTGEVLVDKSNHINFQNMSRAIAQSVAKKATGPFFKMVFGNGGSTTSGVGTITYLPTNTFSANATLYNQTYEKIINDQDPNNLDTTKNRIDVTHINGNLFSDVLISCNLDTGEPAGQAAFDNSVNQDDSFMIDEIGIISYQGSLLSHIIFSPIQKSTNRSFKISYTIRFQMI